MGVHPSKNARLSTAGQQPQSPAQPGAKPKQGADGKKGGISGEKVRKQRVLAFVPPEIFDVKAGEDEKVKKGEETFYKPNLPKAQPIDLPIGELKSKFLPPKSGDQKQPQKPEPKKETAGSGKNTGVNKNPPLSSPKQNQVSPQVRASIQAFEEGLHGPRKSILKRTIGDTAEVQPIRKQTAKQGGGDKKALNKWREITRKHFMKQPARNIKWHLPDVIGTKAEGTSIVTTVLRVLREKAKETDDFVQLAQFDIPDQRLLLTVALDSDSAVHDFGGNLRHYYSPVLRNFTPVNMLDRYRGVPPTSSCLSAIDFTNLGTKASFQENEKRKRADAHDRKLNALLEASVDQKHFEFLKELARNQTVSVPLTLIHDIAKEILPMIKHMQQFYFTHLGETHECTEQAAVGFIKMLNRVIMYNSL